MPPPPFFYQEPYPLGPDTTEYRLLSRDGVSLGEFEGRKILRIEPSALAYLAQQAFHDCSFYLRTEHLRQVSAIQEYASMLRTV